MYSYPLEDKPIIQIKDLSFNSIVETFTPIHNGNSKKRTSDIIFNNNYFIIYMNIFWIKPSGKTGKKNLTITNISKDITNNKGESYELMSIVAHSGTKDFGHYIAYVKRNNKIYKCNDANISQKTVFRFRPNKF